VEFGHVAPRETGSGDAMPAPPWPRLVLQGIGCGLAFAAILVLRSQASLDFIYFQF
jgi:hypothetical protein